MYNFRLALIYIKLHYFTSYLNRRKLQKKTSFRPFDMLNLDFQYFEQKRKKLLTVLYRYSLKCEKILRQNVLENFDFGDLSDLFLTIFNNY